MAENKLLQLKGAMSATIWYKGNSNNRFTSRQRLIEFWRDHDFHGCCRLQYLFDSLVGNILPTMIDTIEKNMITVVSILLYIGFHDWPRFVVHYFDNGSWRENDTRTHWKDKGLPFQETTGPEYLSKSEWDDFKERQNNFKPIIIREGCVEKYDVPRQLPFECLKTHLKPSKGGQGSVETVKIPLGLLEAAYGPKAYSNKEGHIVACKTFKRRPDSETETQILNLLASNRKKHENIAYHLAGADVNGKLYVLFERAQCDLADFMVEDRPTNATTHISSYLWEMYWLTDALDFVHEGASRHRGTSEEQLALCHMDIKPNNILVYSTLNPDQPAGVWKLADFGISKERTLRREKDGTTIRTKSMQYAGPFQPPEVCECEPDGSRFKVGRKGDIWSLGCVLVQVLVYALGGRKEVSKLNDLRATHEDGESEFRDDYFYRFYPESKSAFLGKVNPHVTNWLKTMHATAELPQGAKEKLKMLVESMLKIRAKNRWDASKVLDEIHTIIGLLPEDTDSNILQNSSEQDESGMSKEASTAPAESESIRSLPDTLVLGSYHQASSFTFGAVHVPDNFYAPSIDPNTSRRLKDWWCGETTRVLTLSQNHHEKALLEGVARGILSLENMPDVRNTLKIVSCDCSALPRSSLSSRQVIDAILEIVRPALQATVPSRPAQYELSGDRKTNSPSNPRLVIVVSCLDDVGSLVKDVKEALQDYTMGASAQLGRSIRILVTYVTRQSNTDQVSHGKGNLVQSLLL